jgi:glucan phosphoethanolaminetransferase (alkaline phosphatase superfamily)
VAAAETPQSRAALSLLVVLVLAKALMLAGYGIPPSVWAPFAYFWQDVLVALVFGVVAALIRRRALIWAGYALVVIYVAINVPVTRALSSPLTWTMIRAARGALSDSIVHEVTAMNVASLLLVVAAGVAAPWLLAKLAVRTNGVAIGLSVAFVALGVVAMPRIDAAGRHRNAFGALWPAAGLHAVAGPDIGDWRASPFPSPAGDDLTRYRAAARGRNVVLIVLESTAAQYLKLGGADRDAMPNFTALAAGGLVFDNAYAAYPESIKGLYATLCAREPAYDTAPELYADAPCASIAETLKQAGYRTALFHSGRFAYLGMESIIGHRGFDVLEDAGAIGGHVNSSFGVDEPATVDRMLSWVDGLGPQQRFFLTYLPIAGHHPYATEAPGPFAVTTEKDQYLNALHEGDAAIGRLLAGLRDRRLDSNTLFVIFGDHGEAFGQHQGNFGHTLFIFEENVHVPYVIVMPNGTTGTTGTHVSRAVSVVDTAPTILELLGLPGDPLHQGVSMLDPKPRMALFYTDYSLGWLGLRDECWKYLFEMGSKRSRLFDVCVDPGEMSDKAAERPDRVSAYRARLEQWSATRRNALTRPH